VVSNIDLENRVLINDPSLGLLRMNYKKLKSIWDKKALIVMI